MILLFTNYVVSYVNNNMQLIRQVGVFMAGVLCGLLFVSQVVFATEATSTNFQLSTSGIDSGGNAASSTNYSIEGTIGAFISGELVASEGFQTGGTTGGGSLGGSSGANEVGPVVSTVSFAYAGQGTPLSFGDGVTPTPGTTTDLYIYGSVVDMNGAGTISSVDVTFYRSGLAQGVGCTSNDANCYRVNNCALTQISPSASYYECVVRPQYFADATISGSTYAAENWIALVRVIDATSFSSTKTAPIEMNSLLALDIPSSIAFGEIALGATTTAETNQSITISQRGNTMADIEISASANLACTGAGAIPKENLSWALTDVGFDNASTTPLAVTPVRVPIEIAPPENINPLTADIFLNLSVPESDLQGTCSGAITISMIGV